MLYVPKASLEEEVPPKAPVFFNPLASTNRDVTVAITEAADGTTFCDSLAGVGARGVRVAHEVTREVDVTLADFNRDSMKVGLRNAKANRVLGRCRFVDEETNTFLHSRFRREEKFGYVDVDPFGTPAPYIEGMLAAVADHGIVSVTATDTAVLCGVYPEVCRRRYSSTPLNNHFHHETGIRILLNAIRRQAAARDKGMAPIAAHSTRHYIRVYARVENGARKADASLVNEGYVCVCGKCKNVTSGTEKTTTCHECGGKVRSTGPLWIGSLVEQEVVRRAAEVAVRLEMPEAWRILDSIGRADSYPPWSYSVDEVCSELGTATVPDSNVRLILGEVGFRCESQPFEKDGLKTDAPYREVFNAVKRAAASRPASPRSSSTVQS